MTNNVTNNEVWSISKLEDPIFGFDTIAKSVIKIIQSDGFSGTIGILGNWGMGKTTILNMIKQNFHKSEFIEFNAWKHAHEKFNPAIPLMIDIFQKILEDDDVQTKLKNSEPSMKKKFGNTMMGLQKSMTITMPVGIGVIKFDLSFLNNLKNNKNKIEDYLDSIRPPLITGFEILCECIQNFKVKDNKKLIIFVDDLDRCDPKKIIEIFDSIKAFFDIKKIVFIVCQNESIFKNALQKNYDSEDYDYEDYLNKFIQYPIHIPNWLKIDLYHLFNAYVRFQPELKWIQEHISSVLRLIDNTPRDLETFLNHIQVQHNLINNIHKGQKKYDMSHFLLINALMIHWKPQYDCILQNLNSLNIIFSTKSNNLLSLNEDKKFIPFFNLHRQELLDMTKKEWNFFRKPELYEYEMYEEEDIHRQKDFEDIIELANTSSLKETIQKTKDTLALSRFETTKFIRNTKEIPEDIKTELYKSVFQIHPNSLPDTLTEASKNIILAYHEFTKSTSYAGIQAHHEKQIAIARKNISIVSRRETLKTLNWIKSRIDNIKSDVDLRIRIILANTDGKDYPKIQSEINYMIRQCRNKSGSANNIDFKCKIYNWKNTNGKSIVSFSIIDDACAFSIPNEKNNPNVKKRGYFIANKDISRTVIMEEFRKVWTSNMVVDYK